jgi:molybdate transport system substrate-binding protein
MVRHKSLKSLVLSFAAAIALIACTQVASPPLASSTQAKSEPSTLLITAAASLQKPLQEIAPLYEKAGNNRKANYNFASSGSLQQQIEQGAPADIFISASNKQMEALQQKKLLLDGTRQALLTNRLALITPKSSALKLTDFSQLTRPEIQRISVGEPRSVPAGQYAAEVFKKMGILDQIESKFVFGGNVKSVLASVETGDADAGVVYITDAKDSDKVSISAIANDQLHSPIVYPIAILKSSKAVETSKQYIEFLQSKPAREIFEKYDFGISKP